MFWRYFHTLRYLKAIQIVFQVFYKLRNKLRQKRRFKYSYTFYKKGNFLPFSESAPFAFKSYSRTNEKHHFSFLNLSAEFNQIQWDYDVHGKLWTYNLNYFDFLNQDSISKAEGMYLIQNFIPQLPSLKNANEPYPISLRGINWIKFLSKHGIESKEIETSLYSQYQILLDNLEFHLLGNHLLENAFSLFIGGKFFNDERLKQTGFQLIRKELEEQILQDGAHFELSPMYHQIILNRLLDCYSVANESEKLVLKPYCSKMCGWLKAISVQNGDIPLLNDSAKKICPDTNSLLDYAKTLNIVVPTIVLKDSGYRKFVNQTAELILDAGTIGPTYIPGHAHADIFNFVLYDNGKPLIIDTGISTYEKNQRRQDERSTFSHNTVEVNGRNQVDVWGGFRVGKRAKVLIVNDGYNKIVSSHKGYKSMGVIHERTWENDGKNFQIKDALKGKKVRGKAYFHFHSDVKPRLFGSIVSFDDWTLQISNAKNIYLQEYKYSEEFNKLEVGTVAVVEFEESLHSTLNKVK